MGWISKSEQDIIKEWARENYTERFRRTYLSAPVKEESSYWEEHDERKEIIQHQFDTVIELQQIFEENFIEKNMQDLITPLAVATFKGKIKVDETLREMQKKEDGQREKTESSDFIIPEFRYVF